jgi:hypothetical protein
VHDVASLFRHKIKLQEKEKAGQGLAQHTLA